jgi:hypothetical protein
MVDSPGGRSCVGGERSRMDTELRVFVRVVVFNAPEEIVTLFGPIKKNSAKTRWQFDMQTTVVRGLFVNIYRAIVELPSLEVLRHIQYDFSSSG